MASYLNRSRENFLWNQPNSKFVAILLKPSPDTEPPPQQPQSQVILVCLVHCVIRQQGNPRAMDNPKKLVESCWCLLESGLGVGDTSWGKICFFKEYVLLLKIGEIPQSILIFCAKTLSSCGIWINQTKKTNVSHPGKTKIIFQTFQLEGRAVGSQEGAKENPRTKNSNLQKGPSQKDFFVF